MTSLPAMALGALHLSGGFSSPTSFPQVSHPLPEQGAPQFNFHRTAGKKIVSVISQNHRSTPYLSIATQAFCNTVHLNSDALLRDLA